MARDVSLVLSTAVLLVSVLAGGAGAQEAPHLRIDSRPPGAYVVLDGDVRIEGITPFVVDRPVSGNYEVSAQLPGFRDWNSTLQLAADGPGAMTLEMQRPTMGAAVIRSVALPGWGQKYLGRDVEGALIFFTTGTLFAIAAFQQGKYSTAVDDYEKARDVYEQAGTGAAAEEAFEAMRDSYEHANDHREKRNAFMWSAIAVWGLGIMDTIMNGPDEAPMVTPTDLGAAPLREERPATASFSIEPGTGHGLSLALVRKF